MFAYSDSYATLFPDNESQKSEKQMLNCCLPGAFMNCAGGYEAKYGTCGDGMAQRCSVKWDANCDAYLGNLTLAEAQAFLDNTAHRKYCKVCKNPSSSCKKVMEQVNPLSPNSVEVPFVQGIQTYYQYNGSDNYTCPRNSPAYMERCSTAEKCSIGKLNKNDLTENDPVFQRCLVYNTCGSILNQIPDSKFKKPSNPGLIWMGYM